MTKEKEIEKKEPSIKELLELAKKVQYLENTEGKIPRVKDDKQNNSNVEVEIAPKIQKEINELKAKIELNTKQSKQLKTEQSSLTKVLLPLNEKLIIIKKNLYDKKSKDNSSN